jgi:hypothetical protein
MTVDSELRKIWRADLKRLELRIESSMLDQTQLEKLIELVDRLALVLERREPKQTVLPSGTITPIEERRPD